MVDAQKVGGSKERQRHLGRHIDRVRVQMVEHHEEDGVLDVVECDGLRNHIQYEPQGCVGARMACKARVGKRWGARGKGEKRCSEAKGRFWAMRRTWEADSRMPLSNIARKYEQRAASTTRCACTVCPPTSIAMSERCGRSTKALQSEAKVEVGRRESTCPHAHGIPCRRGPRAEGPARHDERSRVRQRRLGR